MFQKVAFVVLSAIFFASSADALHLDCNYTTDNIWTMSNVFICEANVVRLGDLQTVTSVSENFPIGYNYSDVRGISIMDQTQRYFPRNVSNFFPNIELIRVRNIGLGQIVREDIEGFPALRQISLSVNDVRTITKDLFASNRALQAISFDYNPIMHVAHSAFDNLYSLRWLRFGNTTCIHQQVDDSRELVYSMLFDIFRQCPPTSRMIAEELGILELQSKVNGHELGILELYNKVDENERNISEHADEINRHDGELEGLRTGMTSQGGRIETLEAEVDGHRREISENADEINRHDGELEGLRSGMTLQGIRIETLETSVANHTERIIALEATLP